MLKTKIIVHKISECETISLKSGSESIFSTQKVQIVFTQHLLFKARNILAAAGVI